ncbi:hypothetical protein [Caballeronia sp. LZ028]|uniref:hypothetical protein n=1 Tax=Caballeronia sp. LZ028 TaxID=3038563 RepID=UPI00286788BF|nr:hypothetical protein [Caballeronia sp. LZ028]MDR5765024.1 hypothetical protein [Caballeronia sp. LZ028]
MARLLLRSKGVLRHLASVKVTNDGSIKLNLVREGISEGGYQWSFDGAGPGPVSTQDAPEPKTKSITIHTSGRINYHFGGGSSRCVPCLLDLEQIVPIVAYSIPSVDLLDAVGQSGEDDWVCDFPSELEHRIVFSFSVLPAVQPPVPGELGRFGVEGLFALAWCAEPDPAGVTKNTLPDAVFTTLRPGDSLPAQAAREEEVYLRFRRAMYANDIATAVANLPNSDAITAEQVEAMIQAGPGLYPPNKEGIWTVLSSVPMRIAPRLEVSFEDERFRAEVVDLRPGDTRLATVRVRFKVFDEHTKRYVKGSVAIRGIALHAEL